MTTTKAEKLRSQRDALNKKIKAAERAEKAAADKALLVAQQTLGVWLAKGANARTVEAVKAIKTAVDLTAIRAVVETALQVEEEVADDAPEEQSNGDGPGDDHEADGAPSDVTAVHQNSSPAGPEFSARNW